MSKIFSDKVGEKMDTIRLTVSQALVKFLNAQYVEYDGEKSLLSKESLRFSVTEMCWGSVKHFKKTLEGSRYIKEEMNKGWHMLQRLSQNKSNVNK